MRTKTGKIHESRTLNKDRRAREARAAKKAPRPVTKRSTVLHKSEARRRRRIMRQARHLDIKVPGHEDDHNAVLEAIRAFCRVIKRITAV